MARMVVEIVSVTPGGLLPLNTHEVPRDMILDGFTSGLHVLMVVGNGCMICSGPIIRPWCRHLRQRRNAA
jgi:hypothetical protein